MKDKSVRAASGIATLRVLAGAVGVADFTVNSLARRTGVPRETVDTVLRRYRGAFLKLDSVSGGGRGRPAVRWQLRSEAIDEVVSEVKRLQTVVVVGDTQTSLDSDLVEASLTMAADSLVQASGAEPEAALSLIESARSSLVALGFDKTTEHSDSGLRGTNRRARVISAVADVVEADATGDLERLDAAQARALPIIRDTRSSMSADEWLPLANCVVEAGGTVLASPVEVFADGGEELFQSLFPHLVKISVDLADVNRRLEPPDLARTSVWVDERIALGVAVAAGSRPVMFEVSTERFTEDLLRSPLRHARSGSQRIASGTNPAAPSDPDTMGRIARDGAQLVLVGQDVRRDVARAVNRTAVGLDAGMSEHYLLVGPPLPIGHPHKPM